LGFKGKEEKNKSSIYNDQFKEKGRDPNKENRLDPYEGEGPVVTKKSMTIPLERALT